MATTLRAWITGLGRIGWRPDDPEELRLQKTVVTFCSVFITLLAFVWVGTYLALGLPRSAAIPAAYQVVSIVGLVAFWRTKRFAVLRTLQLILMLLLPFALQWTLGGFVAASAVCLWALVSPMGALMFGARPWPWFGGFFLLLGVSGALEVVLTPAAVPVPVQIVFFVLNLGATSLTVFMLLVYFHGQRDAARAALAHEREKSERLLLNILPEPIAERLKEGEEVIADAAEVSVLFADIVGFTPLSGRLGPREVVALLNDVFSELDGLADSLGLEKIKTVGDAYMCVAGVPVPRADHAAAIAEMALGLVRTVSRFSRPDDGPLQVRIGIDCGPVVAGVIGRRKFSYDLWGDTVNTASRMESHGVPGRIQVTERFADRLRDRYRFEPRGPVEVKGKGPMQTWFLIGRVDERPETAVGAVPESG